MLPIEVGSEEVLAKFATGQQDSLEYLRLCWARLWRIDKDVFSVNERAVRATATVIGLITIAIAGYYAVAGVLDPGKLISGTPAQTAQIFADYVAVRSFVLLGAIAVFALARNWRLFEVALALNGFVQAGDGVLGIIQHDVLKTVGPGFLALLLLGSAAWLARNRARANSPG
jgi:hypothetical protein